MARDEMRETQDLLAVENWLVRLYGPQVGQAEIHRELRAAYHRFDDAPIRTYVMLLTERATRQRLAVLACAASTHHDRVVGATA